MCLYPRLIKNKRYEENKKNGGQVPSVTDRRVLYVPIACGNCMECRKQKAREWQVRLLEDIKTNTNGKMVTLTFSNESIKKINEAIPKTFKNKKGAEMPLEGYKRDNEIAIYAVRHWLERWRKKYKKSIRHWLVTELGHKGTENIHLHGIIWTNESINEIEKTWQYGFIWKGNIKNGRLINYVSNRTVNYIVKYVSKIDQQHKHYKSKTLTSSGIGGNYTERNEWKKNKYNTTKTDETYRTPSGHKIKLPIYWRNKIYTEEEKEKLWIEKLDKQERWVDGIKIDISKETDTYYKILEEARIKNNTLGYGTDKKNWQRDEYEQQRRNMLLEKRIQTPSAGSNQKGMD